MNVVKRFFFIYICVFSATIVKSQSSKPNGAGYDSTFNNYLYDTRTAYFRGLPASKNEIVFLGNSIAHWGDWAELLNSSKVRNRGIAGDISYGVLARIDEVVNRKPSKIFIMIGVNDIGREIPFFNTLANYEKILLKIKAASPKTQVFIQSVLPINENLINRQYYTGTNSEIARLNSELKKLASRHSIVYLDLYTYFIDSAGQMHLKYTYDGIHLSAEGYLLWTKFLINNKYCCK